MTAQPSSTRRDVELQLIKRAWTDATFARQLQEDPRRAVEQALGVELPAGITIQVVQETPTTLYLVVPPSPDALPAGDLTDADLVGVAGGGWTSDTCTCTCSGCVANDAPGCIDRVV